MTPEEVKAYVDEQLSSINKVLSAQDKRHNLIEKRLNGLEARKFDRPAPRKRETEQEDETIRAPKKTFTVDGEKYQFRVAKFKWQGKLVTAEEAMEDTELLAGLVKKRSGLIRQIF